MAVYFQPVLDQLALQFDETLDKLRKLCEAVLAEDRGTITLELLKLVKLGRARSRPIEDVPEAIFHETMARLLTMGADQDLQVLIDWYEPLTVTLTVDAKLVENYLGMFAFLPDPAGTLSEPEIARVLGRITKALLFLLPRLAVAAAKVPRPAYSATENVFDTFTLASGMGPGLVGGLSDGVRQLVGAWMALHQQLLDAALAHFASGGVARGEKLLALRERWAGMVQLIFPPGRPQRVEVAQLAIPLARIKYGRSPNHEYLDAFKPYNARRFGFVPYDREPPAEPAGKLVGLFDLIRSRTAQLYFFLDAVGEYVAPQKQPANPAERKEEQAKRDLYAARRKIIDGLQNKTGALRFQVEDDLVAFGCAFFHGIVSSQTGKTATDARAEAFTELLKVMGGFLRTQTAHTEFNLDEKTKYFDVLFPRAINGAVLNDCGVYAVRLSYILLSIAHCIKTADASGGMDVDFIFLPLHVGLIVRSAEFGNFVIHNASIFRFSKDQAAEWRFEWDKGSSLDPKPDTPQGDALEAKFYEDVAAAMYLTDVDLPLFTVPIKPVSRPPKKAEIWKAYGSGTKQIERMFSAAVSSAGSSVYQLDLMFLDAMDREKSWSDETVVPFWNDKCFNLWNKTDANKNRVHTVDGLKRNASLRTRYAEALQKLVDEVDQSYQKDVFEPIKKPLTDEFRKVQDKALGKATKRVTASARLRGAARGLTAVGLVRTHIQDIRAGHVEQPPFATEADYLMRSGN